MWQQFHAWRTALPFTDPLERRQALLLQTMELSIAVLALLLLPLTLLSERPLAALLIIDALLLAASALSIVSVLLLRRGALNSSALLVALTLVCVLCAMLYGNTLADGAVIVFALALPITISGMLAGRRGVITTCTACALGVGAVALLERAGAPGVGFATRTGDNTLGNIIAFTVLAGLLGFFVESLRAQAAEAIAARRSRERELEAMGRRLELMVRDRTADLEVALGALEQRADEAERLLDENHRQRNQIRSLSVPVLPLNSRTLVMPLVGDLDSQRLEDVQAQALDAVERLAARRLLLDITGVPIVDTQIAHGLMRTLAAARLLGAEVVLVGVRPKVAQAVVGLGVDLGDIPAFADLQSALR